MACRVDGPVGPVGMERRMNNNTDDHNEMTEQTFPVSAAYTSSRGASQSHNSARKQRNHTSKPMLQEQTWPEGIVAARVSTTGAGHASAAM